MGASFRSKQQVLALTGCDFLTISPSLLTELSLSHDPIVSHLNQESVSLCNREKVTFDEKGFRWELGKDLCATYKLAEGIVKFAEDTVKLENFIRPFLETKI
eukprot:TRINITY_DN2985_c0_g2_i4.p2 TRINITY_DN2985_c0_g2~~TRINITY_DN2985_c0_g2_i4.p2  ORF type:complete len:102 (-),score=27.48 TRINITY_DN2985_c0_g2_i4:177-482(-)